MSGTIEQVYDLQGHYCGVVVRTLEDTYLAYPPFSDLHEGECKDVLTARRWLRYLQNGEAS